jgi:hypothetical protein
MGFNSGFKGLNGTWIELHPVLARSFQSPDEFHVTWSTCFKGNFLRRNKNLSLAAPFYASLNVVVTFLNRISLL